MSARARSILKSLFGGVLSDRTMRLLWLDRLRLRARLKRMFSRNVVPAKTHLHLGCGVRRVSGWLNVDVAGSDYDVDLTSGKLPWRSDAFDAIVSQHLIEHLDLHSELLPLLHELRRVLKPSCLIWVSCPDIEKVCRSYQEGRMQDLIQDAPSSHMINDIFHQGGEHKNLFDLTLIDWALRRAGFAEITRVAEADLLERYPEIPPRGDDAQTIYVRAIRT
jgi:predicted SAM-dependent methyltransferase